MKQFSSYNRLKFLIGAFLALYVVVAVLGDFYAARREFFPAFSWSLFSDVPGKRSTYELYIHRVDDTLFEEPVNFYDLPDYFDLARKQSSTIAKSVKWIARNIKDDPETVAANRAVFEAQLLSDHARVDYEIARVVFRPLERWQRGEVISRRSIGRFIARKSQ